MKVALQLFHGRADPDADMEDWGQQGPIFLVDYVHTTYSIDIKLGIPDPAGDGDLKILDDLVYYDGMYYGDWSTFPADVAEKSVEHVHRIVPFDPTKAKPPDQNTPPMYATRALALLRQARNLLRLAGSRRSLARVRLAITSTGGAVRHAHHRYQKESTP